MASSPIFIQKIFIKGTNGSFQERFLLEIKGSHQLVNELISREQLEKLQRDIEQELTASSTAEVLGIDEEKGQKVDEANGQDPICSPCNQKKSQSCITCLFVLQSPLERILYREFMARYIRVEPQMAIRWDGSIELNREKVKFGELLTVPDFMIRKHKRQLCIYADGHTYHERTEEQALRDRNIDRKLQDLGFFVMRFTGKEIREGADKVMAEVENWIGR